MNFIYSKREKKCFRKRLTASRNKKRSCVVVIKHYNALLIFLLSPTAILLQFSTLFFRGKQSVILVVVVFLVVALKYLCYHLMLEIFLDRSSKLNATHTQSTTDRTTEKP